jgi:hypothetical protein
MILGPTTSTATRVLVHCIMIHTVYTGTGWTVSESYYGIPISVPETSTGGVAGRPGAPAILVHVRCTVRTRYAAARAPPARVRARGGRARVASSSFVQAGARLARRLRPRTD